MKKGLILSLAGIYTSVLTAAVPTGSYKKIVDQLNALQSTHSKFVHVFSIGTNDEGTDIYAIRVSANPTQVDPSKIGHLMVGTHHGNETHAPVLVMSFLASLISRYESEALFRENLTDIEWTLVPVLNVTGYNASRREEYQQDPNRDYPGPCISQTGGNLKSIRTIMDFMNTRQFSGGVTVHGYLGALTFPWGMNVDNVETHDHNLFSQATAKAAQENGYRYGTSTDVVYACEGSFEDYIYWKHGMWSLLVELEDGTSQDIANTTKAVEVFYNEMTSSPSTVHQFDGKCLASRGVDLHIE